jgi:hypothetical protein
VPLAAFSNPLKISGARSMALTIPRAFAQSVKVLQVRFLSVRPHVLSNASTPRRNRAVGQE